MARAFDLLIVVALAVLAVWLPASGLHRRYRAFFAYLIWALLRNGALAIPRPDGQAYYLIWTRTEPLEWLLYVLVVLEIYSLVLEDYRGLATVGRWTLIVAVCVALLASGLALAAPSHYTTQGLVMRYYYVADRAVYFSLVVFLLTLLGLLMQYPISLSRNVLLHSVVFSVYFLANTVMFLLLSMRGSEVIGVLRIGFQATTLAAVCVWIGLLRPAGELRKQRLRPAWMPGREEELVSQLNHLNAALLRVTRK